MSANAPHKLPIFGPLDKEMRLNHNNTVHKLLAAYSSLSVDQLLPLLSPDFTHQVLPESLGMPIRDRGAFALHAIGIFSIFEKFQMTAHVAYYDQQQDVTVIQAVMDGTLKNRGNRGNRDGRWINECVMIVRLSRDGLQVTKIQEFVDSAKAIALHGSHTPDNFLASLASMDSADMESEEDMATRKSLCGRDWGRKAMFAMGLAAGTYVAGREAKRLVLRNKAALMEGTITLVEWMVRIAKTYG